jgi:hypothetical protein
MTDKNRSDEERGCDCGEAEERATEYGLKCPHDECDCPTAFRDGFLAGLKAGRADGLEMAANKAREQAEVFNEKMLRACERRHDQDSFGLLLQQHAAMEVEQLIRALKEPSEIAAAIRGKSDERT